MKDVKPLEESYFVWLYGTMGVISQKNPASSHWLLCEKLFKTPFFWYVRNDDNRAADGMELRQAFLNEHKNITVTANWMSMECSILEMLIALAHRTSEQGGSTALEWFWTFLNNLGLYRFTDDIYNGDVDVEVQVENILTTLVERTYRPNGEGGIFPLNEKSEDQRKVEIWYQMSAYIMENEQ